MARVFCKICNLEMVKEERVKGDPALDCGGDCAGCLAEIEGQMEGEPGFRPPPRRAISRREYPDIYELLAEVYGGTTGPLPDMPNRIEAADLQPLTATPDGTPI